MFRTKWGREEPTDPCRNSKHPKNVIFYGGVYHAKFFGYVLSKIAKHEPDQIIERQRKPGEDPCISYAKNFPFAELEGSVGSITTFKNNVATSSKRSSTKVNEETQTGQKNVLNYDRKRFVPSKSKRSGSKQIQSTNGSTGVLSAKSSVQKTETPSPASKVVPTNNSRQSSVVSKLKNPATSSEKIENQQLKPLYRGGKTDKDIIKQILTNNHETEASDDPKSEIAGVLSKNSFVANSQTQNKTDSPQYEVKLNRDGRRFFTSECDAEDFFDKVDKMDCPSNATEEEKSSFGGWFYSILGWSPPPIQTPHDATLIIAPTAAAPPHPHAVHCSDLP